MVDPTFERYIDESHSFLIISANPVDNDTIASNLILRKYLQSRKPGATIISVSPEKINEQIKENFVNFPYFDEIQFTDTRSLIKENNFDMMILVDSSNLSQFSDDSIPEVIDLSRSKHIVHIDHHPIYATIGTYNIHDIYVSSVAELLINKVIPESFIDKNIATLAYMAIIEDTGRFQWNFFPTTFRDAAMLLEHGIDIKDIADTFYFNKPKSFFTWYAWIVNHLVFDDDLQTIFLYLDEKTIEENNISPAEKLEIKDILSFEISKYVKGYLRSMFVYQLSPTEVYVSIRANEKRNTIDLPHMLISLGAKGGGHKYACSGIFSNIPFDEVKVLLQKGLKEALEHPQTQATI